MFIVIVKKAHFGFWLLEQSGSEGHNRVIYVIELQVTGLFDYGIISGPMLVSFYACMIGFNESIYTLIQWKHSGDD